MIRAVAGGGEGGAAEALGYNRLVRSWPEIARLAQAQMPFPVGEIGPRLPDGRETATMPRLFTDPDALAALCRRYRIRRLSLFGSALKGRARPDSDIDLLVQFESDAEPSLLTMAEIELQLSPLPGQRKVDLRTAEDLSRYLRDEVVRTAEVQYEAG